MGKKLQYIDLFSGCGGLSLGFYNSGLWHGSFAVEKSKMAFDTLKHNLIDIGNHFDWPKEIECKEYEINELLENNTEFLKSFQGKIDLVAGGPPCQGFSTAGRRAEDDIRNNLVHSYIKFVELVKPKVIFFENVKGFTLEFQKNKVKGKNFSEEVILKLKDLGYSVHGQMLNFSDYGIPQGRKRYILVGINQELADKKSISAEDFFKRLEVASAKILKKKGLLRSASIYDAISDLEKSNGFVSSPDGIKFAHGKYGVASSSLQKYLRENYSGGLPNSHRFAKHNSATEARFRRMIETFHSDEGVDESVITKKRNQIVLKSNRASPTLTTLPDDYLHYKEPRILTVREYARIQTFNDWFEITGKYTTGGKLRKQETPRYTQMGNAIPPLFAEQAGIILHDLIKDE